MTEAKLKRICARANTGTALLQNLPKTCQWAGILRTSVKHLETAHQIMGLDFCPGAIFTGPEGNGRHTHANALANNLVEKAGYRAVIDIHGSDLNFENPDDLYEVLDFLEKIAMGSGSTVLLLDQPELGEHSLQFQNQLLRLQQSLLTEKKTIFLIVITESAEDVAANLLSRFPRYHCPKPDSKAVAAFVEEMLKSPVPIHIEKVSKTDIISALKNCSWKQLKDLHNQLLRMIVIHYQLNFKKYKTQGYTEEQVYQEGLIKLSGRDAKAILASIADQNPQPATPVVPTVAVSGGIPVTQPIFTDPPHTVPTGPADTGEDTFNPYSTVITGSDDPVGVFIDIFGNIPEEDE